MTAALLMSLCLLAPGKKPPPPPPPAPPDPSVLRLGLWIEIGPGRDSVEARSFARELAAFLQTKTIAPPASQSVRIDRTVLVPQGSLPLAGGDPHHHPDMRAQGLDMVWGIPRTDSLSRSTLESIARTLLVSRGCLDERGFSVGWDLFSLPERAENRLPRERFPLDGRNMIRWPDWSLLQDSVAPRSCLRALRRHPAGRGTLFSDLNRVSSETSHALSQALLVRAYDASGHPASAATLELWRGTPDPRRPFASRFSGAPMVLVADDSGVFDLRTPLRWLADDSAWIHGRGGSRGVTFWRLRHAHRELSGWMDASELLGLPEDRDTLRLVWTLPAGSSQAWMEASEKWPTPWLAGEVDSTGTVTIGISVPVETRFVLRLVDERGVEAFRSNPIVLRPGVYEKRLERRLSAGSWDVRLDAPSSRLQVRIRSR